MCLTLWSVPPRAVPRCHYIFITTMRTRSFLCKFMNAQDLIKAMRLQHTTALAAAIQPDFPLYSRKTACRQPQTSETVVIFATCCLLNGVCFYLFNDRQEDVSKLWLPSEAPSPQSQSYLGYHRKINGNIKFS